MIALIVILILLFAILGTPLFAVFGGASLGLFEFFPDNPDTPLDAVVQDVFSEKFADSPLMVTIPLFIVSGYLMAESGTPKRLVELSRAWLGWMPGGLAIVCLGASAFFTTFTGGSGITIVAIGGLLYPALIQERYPERFSLGLVTAGGSLGLLFPPSLPLILYGVVGGVLIDKLFLAGLIPGILTVLVLSIYASFVGIKVKLPRTKFDTAHAFKTLWKAKWEVALPFVLVGGLATGLLRIHEAAAFTAFYVLIVEVFVYKDITLRGDVPKIIREAVTMFGAILIILATAIGFTGYLIQAKVPDQILDLIQGFVDSKIAFLLVLNVFLLVVGMLMDIFSAIVVVVPLIIPIARHFGVDPYHLAIVFLLNLEIGYLTPPVGLNLFISSFRFDKPVTLLYKAVLPFIGLLVVALLVTTYVPILSTYLTGFVEQDAIDLDAIPDRPLEDGAEGEPIDLDSFDDDDFDLDALEGDDFDLDALEGDSDAGADASEPPKDLDSISDDDEITLDDLE